MTETTESIDQSPIVPDAPVAERGSGRLNQVAAWVGIVAGIVFIVGSVFFTGFFLGRHSGHDGGWKHHRGDGQMQLRGGPEKGPGMMGPGMMGPGMGPGMMGPGRGPGMGPDRNEDPGQPPTPPSSAAPRP